MSENTLSFTVKFDVKPANLHVVYTVGNHGDQTAYLLNRLFDNEPDLKIRPDRVLVDLGPGKAVHLSKRLPDIPEERTVLAPYAPYVSRVSQASHFAEQFVVPLPLEVWWPSGYELLPHREKPVERKFEEIDLRIDFYWSAEGVTEKKALIGDDEVIIPVFPPTKRPKFGSLKSEVFREKIHVLDPRLD